MGRQNNIFRPRQVRTPENSSDTTQPVVVRTNPTEGASGISRTSKIMATFSEPMLSSSVTTSTFTLKASGSSTRIPGVVSLRNGIDASFAPLSALKPSTTYVAAITTRAKDLAGNPLSVVKTWSFTTASHNSNTINADNTTSGTDSEHPIGNESAGFSYSSNRYYTAFSDNNFSNQQLTSI